MKFPVWGWDRQIVCALRKRPNSIVFTNSVTMAKENDGSVRNEECKVTSFNAFGAYIDFSNDGVGLESKWSYKKPTNDFMFAVPSVMGATYASSVKWWKYIRGLEGLRSYGEDESYMAIKTWLMGGRCYILPYLGIGHLYRQSKPYTHPNSDHIFNKIFLVELFVEVKERQGNMLDAIRKRYGAKSFSEALGIIKEKKAFIEEMKNYIKERQVRSLEYFENEINKPFLDAAKNKR